MEDQLIIESYKILCNIGTTPEEKETPQLITLDLKLFLSFRAAGIQDDLSKTIDYTAVLAFLELFIKNNSFNLIEAVAEKTAQAILDEFPVKAVELQVSKSPFPNPVSMKVKVFREREEGHRKVLKLKKP